MEKLYALAVNGRMLYYHGTIDESKFALIDAIAKGIPKDSPDYKIFGQKFAETVKEELNIELSLIRIAYVFRA